MGGQIKKDTRNEVQRNENNQNSPQDFIEKVGRDLLRVLKTIRIRV